MDINIYGDKHTCYSYNIYNVVLGLWELKKNNLNAKL